MRDTHLQESERLAYCAGEAAQLLGYSRNGFTALLDAGLIPSFRQGKKRIVRRADLLSYLEKGLIGSER
jgi:excisionase family DNA binding protein